MEQKVSESQSILCPFCGKAAARGRIMSIRCSPGFFWASDNYFRKHRINPADRTCEGIEADGGIVVYTGMPYLFADPPEAYCCMDCRKIFMDF